uniref:Uncharacterized protein n=1 Tax=Maylandia zebra TaxID=106582 RepID=A0A3P9AXB6_9CICH
MLFTSILTVPDLCGVPPSTAINFKEKCGCRSLSKGFWSTISTYLPPSGFECLSRKVKLRTIYHKQEKF